MDAQSSNLVDSCPTLSKSDMRCRAYAKAGMEAAQDLKEDDTQSVKAASLRERPYTPENFVVPCYVD